MNIKIYIKFWNSLLKREKMVNGYKKSIFNIDFASFKDKFDLIIFDYDDTIADFHGKIDPKVGDLLMYLHQMGFKIGVVSNCSKKRFSKLKKLLEKLNIYLAPSGNKPSPKGFFEILSHYEVSPKRTVSIGDRLGTECYAAKLSGIERVYLVERYSKVFGGKKANIFHRAINGLEKKIYFNT